MKVRVHVYTGNYDNKYYEYDNVDHWMVSTEHEALQIFAKDEHNNSSGFSQSFSTQVASFQRGTWNFIENVAYTDLCKHCGKSAEADGDHTCTCPKSDEDCTDHA